MIGLFGLIYSKDYKYEVAPEAWDEIKDLNDTDFYKFIDKLADNDPRRLQALDPARMRRLLEKGRVTVSKLFHIPEDLVMIKRYFFPNHHCKRSKQNRY